MKVLFLDIDGVLNNEHSRWTEWARFDDASGWDHRCVKELKRVVEATGCLIVLSSMWRFDSIDKINAAFSLMDIPMLHDTTSLELNENMSWAEIRRQDLEDEEPEQRAHINRGFIIQKWIDEHKPERYAIVDDIADMLDDQRSFFVHTDDERGLTTEQADELIRILNS